MRRLSSCVGSGSTLATRLVLARKLPAARARAGLPARGCWRVPPTGRTCSRPWTSSSGRRCRPQRLGLVRDSARSEPRRRRGCHSPRRWRTTHPTHWLRPPRRRAATAQGCDRRLRTGRRAFDGGEGGERVRWGTCWSSAPATGAMSSTASQSTRPGTARATAPLAAARRAWRAPPAAGDCAASLGTPETDRRAQEQCLLLLVPSLHAALELTEEVALLHRRVELRGTAHN